MPAVRNAVKSFIKSQGYDIVSLPEDRSDGMVVRVTDRDRAYKFWVANRLDFIQREHWRGRLYEPEELDLIDAYSERRGLFVDIGANVGNHSIVAIGRMGYDHAIAFEPSAPQKDILAVNVALNAMSSRIDLREIALSDQSALAVIERPDRHNIGRDRLAATGDGQRVGTARGDTLLADEPVDFIKIDVEGHEMRVLHGLKGVLEARRPRLFVEVDNENRDEFDTWRQSHGYLVAERFRRYEDNENVVLVPGKPRWVASPS